MVFPRARLALILSWLLPLALLCARGGAQTTVPIYLPNYSPKWWNLVRGSIVASNDIATTYTIFCPPEDPPKCDVALEFPFVFAEGPETLKFSGTVTSTFTNNIACKLAGTTAATCTGYSSLKKGYVVGQHTGPTEIVWSSTMTGDEVRWGILTLVERASTTDTLEITATAMSTENTGPPNPNRVLSGPMNGIPSQTGANGGERLRSSRGAGLVAAAAAGAVAAALMA